MDFNKLKENMRTISEALADSGRIMAEGVKKSVAPKITLEEAREKIEASENLTKEDIIGILNTVDTSHGIEHKVRNITRVSYEKVKDGFDSLREKIENLSTSGLAKENDELKQENEQLRNQLEKLKEKVDKLFD